MQSSLYLTVRLISNALSPESVCDFVRAQEQIYELILTIEYFLIFFYFLYLDRSNNKQLKLNNKYLLNRFTLLKINKNNAIFSLFFYMHVMKVRRN